MCVYVGLEDIIIVVSLPRLLIVRIATRVCSCFIVSAHAPYGCGADVREWWDMFKSKFGAICKNDKNNIPIIVGIDANQPLHAFSCTTGDAIGRSPNHLLG